jgi:hypothetical protein
MSAVAHAALGCLQASTVLSPDLPCCMVGKTPLFFQKRKRKKEGGRKRKEKMEKYFVGR